MCQSHKFSPHGKCLQLVWLQTQFADVILINRYYAWYEEPGHLELIHDFLSYDLENWYAKHKKPMMISEYGAGTVIGLHVVRRLLMVNCVGVGGWVVRCGCG